jgi:hypothetical protein
VHLHESAWCVPSSFALELVTAGNLARTSAYNEHAGSPQERGKAMFPHTNLRSLSLVPVLVFTVALCAMAEKKPAGPQPHPPTYYVPQLLASVPDAAEKLQFLAPHISYGSYSGTDRIQVDHNGVQMFFSASGVEQHTQYFWSWTGGYNAPVSTPYHSSATFSVLYSQLSSLRYADGYVYVCETNNNCDMLTTPDVPQDHMLMDALLTLAVAAGNTDVAVIDMAWDGVSAKEMKKLKLSDARQVKFADANTPCGAAGIQPGDILTAMEGTPYHQNIYGEMAAKCLKAHPEGCTVHMDALRNGAPIQFAVQVKPAFTPEAAQKLQASAAALAAQNNGAPSAAAAAPAPSGIKLGIQAHNVNDDDAHAAKLPETHGVLVETVEKGGLAETMKMQAGDIVVEMNGAKVSGMDDFRKMLQAGSVTTITVWRAGATVKLEVPESL